MAATITAAGTWTTLNVDLTGMALQNATNPALANPNTLHADKMQFEQLKSLDFPELVQFVQLAASNYGITYQSAKTLLDAIWHGFMNREAATVSSPTYP